MRTRSHKFGAACQRENVVDPESTEAQPSLAEPPDTVNPIPFGEKPEEENEPGVDTAPALTARPGTMPHLGTTLCQQALCRRHERL